MFRKPLGQKEKKIMNFRKILLPAAAVLALTVGAASADAATVVHRTVHRTVVHKPNGNTVVRRNVNRTVVRRPVVRRTVVVRRPAVRRVYITRDRAFGVFRARGVRIVGTPYISGGAYIARCYDPSGRLAYCRVDPYSGAWLGISLHL
jgi:hypothetical protein